MRLITARKVALLLASLMVLGLAADSVTTAAPPPLPNPVLVYMGPEYFKLDGKDWTRYRFAVANSKDYPNALFAAAPNLPPCGVNTKAARTWVDIYEQSGKRLNGFCALGTNSGLGNLWFALESSVVPPSWIYIEMNDRQTNTKYKSNLADTTP